MLYIYGVPLSWGVYKVMHAAHTSVCWFWSELEQVVSQVVSNYSSVQTGIDGMSIKATPN